MKKLILALMVSLCLVLTASLAFAGGVCSYAEAIGGAIAVSATFPVASTTTHTNTYDTTGLILTQVVSTTNDGGVDTLAVENHNGGAWRLAKEVFGREVDFSVYGSNGAYMDSLQGVLAVGSAKAIGGGGASVTVIGGTPDVMGAYTAIVGK
jgi:hypothetical protein